tara:strand:+ start:287 stop:508 length:222 start_codon:yes stop_codon:yes gene_type:complete
MALDKESLQKGISDLFISIDETPDDSRDLLNERIASGLATLIENYVKSGDISTTITGSVDGTDVTGTGIGNIS